MELAGVVAAGAVICPPVAEGDLLFELQAARTVTPRRSAAIAERGRTGLRVGVSVSMRCSKPAVGERVMRSSDKDRGPMRHCDPAAAKLRGVYKQSEYGRVILPLVPLRRRDRVLEPTKAEVTPAP